MTDETQDAAKNEKMMVITAEDLFDLDELRREVERRAAEKIAGEVTKGVLKDVQERITVEIDGQIGTVIMNAITKRRQPTDWMGNPKGPETTLEEEMMKRADVILDQKVSKETGGRPRYNSDKTVSLLQFLVRKSLDQAVQIAIEKTADEIGVKLTDEIPTAYIAEELRRLHQNAIESKKREEEAEDDE